jgi:hypothetical protein
MRDQNWATRIVQRSEESIVTGCEEVLSKDFTE